MSGIHRRNPEKFYPEHEKQVRSEIHGQNGELIFLDKHPIEIVLAVNAYPKMKEVVAAAKEVMEYLEKNGPSIVPHLMDTDENPGQRLREALAQAGGA